MKKFFTAVSLAVVGSMLAVGCSSDTNSDEDQVSLEIFQFKVEFRQQFEDLVAMYEEENPHVSINVRTLGGGSDYGATLRTNMSSGDEPDIFNFGGPTDRDEYREYLADLSDTEAAQLALDGTLDAATDGDEVLGLPYNQEGYGLIYNKRIFEEAGIDPQSILSLDDLENAVQTLDSQKDDLGIDAVFALPGSEAWVLGNHLSNVYLAPEFNHSIIDAYESDTVSFERGDEMHRFLDLQADYSVQPVASLDYSQQVEELFSLQRVAMIQQGNWVYPTVYDMDPDFAVDGIGFIPIPLEGYEDHLPVGIPQYWAVNKNSDDEVVQAAKDFLDWMYTSDAGKDAVINDFNFIPAYEGYDASEIVDPLSKQIYEYSEAGRTIGWVFMGAPTAWSDDELGTNMQRYLSGNATWEETLEDSKKAWESARQ
ncbi:ABC transporter substrate-binding protein [Evansella cellulosilytica]|uniref:Extracellular solute-binding protein family 1 n=1 Tax=Evansella cellulosilytica (strain ATCC 21833 / DSM 2522 / FERM P-1141 / JCM 9156 / N-4) TaxID=649639 RepID=E6TWT2_EVAC2|nr:ABC transporter substrate-binding protein [Evansella cellulosilytica]ADU28765.1 extracellular solute-binding protein family 1 [Evansella cellulosilytica DSM 2522]